MFSWRNGGGKSTLLNLFRSWDSSSKWKINKKYKNSEVGYVPQKHKWKCGFLVLLC